MTERLECERMVRGGLVVDGTGADARRADVAIADGRIVAVGDGAEWHADEEIDATGRVVAPGFIDTHSHDELEAIRNPQMTAKLSQGVTTVVTGNCGMSAAPLAHDGPLPAPYPLIGDDADFRFPTVGAYRDALASARPAVNIAHLAGHSSLRLDNMVDVGRPATMDEVGAMVADLRCALDDGCIGLSSGVDYPPAAAADLAELVPLAAALAPHPGAVYATHIRDEGDEVMAALNEAIATAAAARVPLVLSHHKCAGPANYGRSVETLARIDDARRTQTVALDAYPYTASSTSLLPKFVAASESTLIAWSTPHPETAGRSLDDVAAEWGCERGETIERLSPAGAVYFQIDEGDLQRILRHPAAMIGSDGLPGRSRPHPRLWGSFPRVLARYVRELRVLSLTDGVHKMTGLPAATFALGDRGVIRSGAAADIVVFNPDTIADVGTFEDPEQPAIGISEVIIAGQTAWRDGAATDAHPGRFLALGSA